MQKLTVAPQIVIYKNLLSDASEILKTFKVKKILVNIDTGDCILNAKLYPVFAFLNYNFGSFKINFTGRNQMVLCIQNRPFNIIKTFMIFICKNCEVRIRLCYKNNFICVIIFMIMFILIILLMYKK